MVSRKIKHVTLKVDEALLIAACVRRILLLDMFRIRSFQTVASGQAAVMFRIQ